MQSLENNSKSHSAIYPRGCRKFSSSEELKPRGKSFRKSISNIPNIEELKKIWEEKCRQQAEEVSQWDHEKFISFANVSNKSVVKIEDSQQVELAELSEKTSPILKKRKERKSNSKNELKGSPRKPIDRELLLVKKDLISVIPRLENSFEENKSPRLRHLDQNEKEKNSKWFANWQNKRIKNRSVKEIKKTLIDGYKKNNLFILSAQEMDNLMKEFLHKEISQYRLSIDEPQKLKCIELVQEEFPRVFLIAKKVSTCHLLMDPLIKNLKASKHYLLKHCKQNEFSEVVENIFQHLIKSSHMKSNEGSTKKKKLYHLGLLMKTLEESAEMNPEINLRALFSISICGNNKKKGEEWMKMLEKWNQFSMNSMMKQLHLVNWDHIVKFMILEKNFHWQGPLEWIMQIPLKDLIDSFWHAESPSPTFSEIRVNEDLIEIEMDSKKKKKNEHQKQLFTKILNSIYSHGFPISEENVETQVKKLFKAEAMREMRRKVVWKPLPCEFLLKWMTVNTRLMLRKFMQDIFFGLFSHFFVGFGDDKICQFIISASEEKKHRATQFFSLTIFPRFDLKGPRSHKYDRARPLVKLKIEWTGESPSLFDEMQEKNKDLNVQGYLKILDYSFTDFITEEEKEKIMLSFFYSLLNVQDS